ncbi:hypothetical protein ABPG75_011449 [Micractinium tetrahymenae]
MNAQTDLEGITALSTLGCLAVQPFSPDITLAAMPEWAWRCRWLTSLELEILDLAPVDDPASPGFHETAWMAGQLGGPRQLSLYGCECQGAALPCALCSLPQLAKLAIDEGDWHMDYFDEEKGEEPWPALPPSFSNLRQGAPGDRTVEHAVPHASGACPATAVPAACGSPCSPDLFLNSSQTFCCQSCSALRDLTLDCVLKMDGASLAALCPLGSLTRLRLRSCVPAPPLPEGPYLSSLQHLDLLGTRFATPAGKPEADPLPPAVGAAQQLTALRLHLGCDEPRLRLQWAQAQPTLARLPRLRQLSVGFQEGVVSDAEAAQRRAAAGLLRSLHSAADLACELQVE